MSDTETATPSREARSRLRPRHGFYKVHRADVARITEHGEGHGVLVPVLISAWCALLDLANEFRANTFTAGIGLIRTRAGMSRRTAFTALKVLEKHLKMISHVKNPAKDREDIFDENTWTIYPSENLPKQANGALGKRRTSARKVDQTAHIGLKNSPKRREKEEREATSDSLAGSQESVASLSSKKAGPQSFNTWD